eukprot:2173196-Amphidinium_carterae.1
MPCHSTASLPRLTSSGHCKCSGWKKHVPQWVRRKWEGSCRKEVCQREHPCQQDLWGWKACWEWKEHYSHTHLHLSGAAQTGAGTRGLEALTAYSSPPPESRFVGYATVGKPVLQRCEVCLNLAIARTCGIVARLPACSEA